MSASQRVQLLSGGAEQLAVLSEYLKNPKIIAQLQDEVKALNSLTADEESKVAQARKDLRDHVGKMDILQTSMEELAKAQEAHKELVATELGRISDEHDRFNAIRTELIDKDQKQKDANVRASQERTQLEKDKNSVIKTHNDNLSIITKREDAVKAREDRITSAEIALAAQKKKLDDKLKLLSE